jgi:hypothetical protein
MVLEAKVVFQPASEHWYSLATSTLCIAGPELTEKLPPSDNPSFNLRRAPQVHPGCFAPKARHLPMLVEFAQERSFYSQVSSYHFSVNKSVADIQKASILK